MEAEIYYVLNLLIELSKNIGGGGGGGGGIEGYVPLVPPPPPPPSSYTYVLNTLYDVFW